MNCYRIKIVVLLLTICNTMLTNGQQLSKVDIVGNWIQDNSNIHERIFLENNRFKEFYNGTEAVSVYNTTKKSNTYKLVFNRDTNWLYLDYYKMRVNNILKKKNTNQYAIQLNGNYFTLISYKELKDTYNYIDEYSNWVRKGEPFSSFVKKGVYIIYIFPPNFKGSAWIAFNQKEGVQPTYDSLGNAILTIPENGILLTKLHEDAFATANRNYSIYELSNGKYKSYKTFDKFDKIDSTLFINNENLAIQCGFNQDARESINKLFGKQIQGNIMTIFIGTYKESNRNRSYPWSKEF